MARGQGRLGQVRRRFPFCLATALLLPAVAGDAAAQGPISNQLLDQFLGQALGQGANQAPARRPGQPPGFAPAPQFGQPPAAAATAEIRDAQRLLNALGYPAGPVDGGLGPRTRAALDAFRRDYGLPSRDGIDPQALATLRAVHARSAGAPAMPGVSTGTSTAGAPDGQPQDAGGSGTAVPAPVARDAGGSAAPAGDRAASATLPATARALLPDLAMHDGVPWLNRNDRAAGQAFTNLLELIRLRANPTIIDDERVARRFAQAFLDPARREALLDRRGSAWRGRNEFDRARALEAFRAEDLPRLIAAAPALPLRVVLQGFLSLGEYDRALGGFPVGSFNLSGINDIQFAVPELLAIDPAGAEALVRTVQAGKDSGMSYGTNLELVASVTITHHDRAPSAIRYRLDRLVAYADPDLRVPVHEFPVLQAPVAYLDDTSRPVAPSGPVTVTAETVLLAALAEGTTPEREWVRDIIDRHSLERTIRQRRGGADWQRYDPWGPFFPVSVERIDTRHETYIPDYQAWSRKRGAALPQELVLRSVGSLDDEGKVRSQGVPQGDDMQAVLGDIRLKPIGSVDGGQIGGSEQDRLVGSTVGGRGDRLVLLPGGDALLFDRSVRDYRFPFDAAALRAALDKSPPESRGGPPPGFEVRLTLRRGGLQTIGDRMRVLAVTPVSAEIVVDETVVARGTFEDIGPVPYGTADRKLAPPAADAVPLDGEMADLLFVRHLPASVTDADWERMFAARWALEIATGDGKDPVWGRFFRYVTVEPTEADRDRLMPAFREWTLERAQKLPARFTLAARGIRLPSALSNWGRQEYANQAASCRRTAAAMRASQREAAAVATEKGCDFLAIAAATQERLTPFVTGFRPGGAGPRSACDIAGRAPDTYCRASLKFGDARRTEPPVELFELSEQIAGDSTVGNGQHVLYTISVSAIRLADALPPALGSEALKAHEAYLSDSGLDRSGRSIVTPPRIDLPVPLIVARLEAAAIHDDATGARVAALEVEPIPALPLDLLKTAPVTVQVHDILGIRLDMSFAEAERIVRDHMPVGRVLIADRARQVDAQFGEIKPYSSGKLFISQDGKEYIALFNEPPAAADTVVGVWRRLQRQKGEIDPGELARGVAARYGAPKWRNEDAQHGLGAARVAMIWSNAVEQRQDCQRIDEAHQNGLWLEEDGRPSTWAPGSVAQPGLVLPQLGSEYIFSAQYNHADTAFCKPLLGMSYVTYNISQAYGRISPDDLLTFWLSDQAGYRDVLARSRTMSQAAAPAPASMSDRPASSIKY